MFNEGWNVLLGSQCVGLWGCVILLVFIKVVTLLQSVNVKWLFQHMQSVSRKAEHIWDGSAETESSCPVWCILGVINPALMQLNILAQDSAAVFTRQQSLVSPDQLRTLTLCLILSCCQGHTSILSYIRVDFAPCGVLNPFSLMCHREKLRSCHLDFSPLKAFRDLCMVSKLCLGWWKFACGMWRQINRAWKIHCGTKKADTNHAGKKCTYSKRQRRINERCVGKE